MTQQTLETKIALLEERVRTLGEHVDCLETDQKKALVWGIVSLGGIVLALIAFVGTFVKDHVKWS